MGPAHPLASPALASIHAEMEDAYYTYHAKPCALPVPVRWYGSSREHTPPVITSWYKWTSFHEIDRAGSPRRRQPGLPASSYTVTRTAPSGVLTSPGHARLYLKYPEHACRVRCLPSDLSIFSSSRGAPMRARTHARARERGAADGRASSRHVSRAPREHPHMHICIIIINKYHRRHHPHHTA